MDSQCGLGKAYTDGKGVSKDYLTAYAWYSVAAANVDSGSKVEKTESPKT